MRTRSVIPALILVFIVAAPGVATVARAQERFSVSDLLKVKRITDPQLSPDGTRVAFVVTSMDEAGNSRNSDIWIVPVDGGAPRPLIASDKNEDRPRWSPDGTRLAFVSDREHGSQIWIADVKGDEVSNARRLTGIATEASGALWSPDGRWIAFTSEVYPDCADGACNKARLEAREKSKVRARTIDSLMFRHWNRWREGRVNHIFVMAADGSGQPRDLTPGDREAPPFSLGGPEDYAFSPDSRELAFVRRMGELEATSTNTDIFVVDVAGGGAPRAITANPAADGGPRYSPDGRYIAYRAQARAGFESDRWALMVYDRQAGTHREVTTSFDRPVEDYTWSPDSRSIYLTADMEAEVPILRVAATGGVPAPIVKNGTNGDVRLSRDGARLVFARHDLQSPAELFTAASDGSNVRPLTTLNADLLKPFGLEPAERVTYKGAGGTPIQAWIVKPAGFDAAKRYPLLFLVHGGPQSVFGNAWSYRWNPHVFAAAGYVVFMPNPRGSTGFGQRFTDEISGDWAGKVFDDLMLGLDYAQALPYVDRERVGSAGASYGGYMMNWFLGHTDRFRAIVSHAGVFNLTSMYGATEELWFPEWEFGGPPWEQPEVYEKWSPHRAAARFRTPTLVTHGELDFRVPITEGLQLFTTLQRLGVPSRLLYFPDEGHWIGKPQNSALWYRTVIEWLDRWVKAEGAAKPSASK